MSVVMSAAVKPKHLHKRWPAIMKKAWPQTSAKGLGPAPLKMTCQAAAIAASCVPRRTKTESATLCAAAVSNLSLTAVHNCSCLAAVADDSPTGAGAAIAGLKGFPGLSLGCLSCWSWLFLAQPPELLLFARSDFPVLSPREV